MLAVFRRLYAARFPIRRMQPVDAYGAHDFRSIEADNTSAFNCRFVDGTTRWSEHAYGRAIDINPIENPYVDGRGTTSHPASGPSSTARAVPAGHGRRGRRRGARVRRGRLGLGRALVGRPRLPALLGQRTMTGAIVLVAGATLVVVGSLRVACLLSPRSTASFLLTAYVAGWVQLVVVIWALSAFDWVSRWFLLGALALVCAALCFDTRGRSDIGSRLRESAFAAREALREPVAVVLGVAVLAGLGYAVALGLGTPQNDFDTLVDHLWRAGLWLQNGGAGYPDCDCAPYINAYPPHAELGVLATMALGGSDRYVALVQGAAYVALVLGVIGIARGLRLDRPEALVAGLLVGTLPVIALQASTAQNDLLVASFVVAAVVFLLDRYTPAAPWLAGAATALALGTKVTALIAVPLLLVIAFVVWPERKGLRLTAVVLGAAVGSYWYVVNWRHTGSWDGGFPYVDVDRSLAPTVARGLRSAIQLIELPGGAGRDRWLFAVTALLLLAGLVAFAWRSDRESCAPDRRDRRRRRAAPCAHAGPAALRRPGIPRSVAGARPRRSRARGGAGHHHLRLQRDVVRASRRAPARVRPRRRGRRRAAWADPRGRSAAGVRAGLLARRALGLALLPGRGRPVPDGAGRARRRGLGARPPRPPGRMGGRGDRDHGARARGAERLEAPIGGPPAATARAGELLDDAAQAGAGA